MFLAYCSDHCFIYITDYVQVVDMGTLELRITAVKPGADGKLVSLSTLNRIFHWKEKVWSLFCFCLWGDSQSPDLSCAAPVMWSTSERVRTPALPWWTSSSMWPAMGTWCPRRNRRPSATTPHKKTRWHSTPELLLYKSKMFKTNILN